MSVSVPGYPNLRYIGGAAAKPAEQHIAADTLERLQQAAVRLGVRFIDIFSGSGGPAVRGGGFAGDPHDRAIAADASINGTPVGSYPGAVAVLHSVGLRTGATDFSYQGKPDPAHVDTVGMSSTATPAAAVSSADGFFRAVLVKLGAPINQANLDSLRGWAAVEGTSAAYNPLATTLDRPGATKFNSIGVRNYTSAQQGVDATAATLRSYPSIVAGFKAGTGLQKGNGGITNDLSRWVDGHLTSHGIAYAQVVEQRAKNPGATPAGFWHDPVVDTVKAGAESALAVVNILGKLTDPSYLLRGMQILAGAVLVLTGIVLLTRQVALAADVPLPPGGATVAGAVT